MLKIKLWRFENELVGFVAEQDSRGIDFKASNGFQLGRAYRPELVPLVRQCWLRGSATDRDDTALYYRFDTADEAARYAADLRLAVEEYNAQRGCKAPEEPMPKCERVMP